MFLFKVLFFFFIYYSNNFISSFAKETAIKDRTRQFLSVFQSALIACVRVETKPTDKSQANESQRNKKSQKPTDSNIQILTENQSIATFFIFLDKFRILIQSAPQVHSHTSQKKDITNSVCVCVVYVLCICNTNKHIKISCNK